MNVDRSDTETSPAGLPDADNVLPFRPRTTPVVTSVNRDATETDEPDDFGHRMLVNAAGLVCAAALVGGGIWLASSIASLRNTQDCVLSGRRNCAPIAAVDKVPSAGGQH